jgi:hypothetical protein
MNKVTPINHIVSMKDEKEYLKPNINALIKWWVLLICHNYSADDQ